MVGDLRAILFWMLVLTVLAVATWWFIPRWWLLYPLEHYRQLFGC